MIALRTYQAALDRIDLIVPVGIGCAVLVIVLIAASAVYFNWQRRRIEREAARL